jgi:riboflavin biosynthesis pyrimidine reductase
MSGASAPGLAAIAATRKQGNQQEQLSNVSLEAGTFYIRVLLERGSATRHVVTMSPSLPSTPTPVPINVPG